MNIWKFIIQTNHWRSIWRLKCIISLLQEEFFLENQTLVKTANKEAFIHQMNWITVILQLLLREIEMYQNDCLPPFS